MHEFSEWVAIKQIENETPEERDAAKSEDVNYQMQAVLAALQGQVGAV